MNDRRKLQLKPTGDPAFPHLTQVIDAKSGEVLSHVTRLDVCFIAGEPLAPGTMHHYKLREDGHIAQSDSGDSIIEQETVDIVGLL